MLEYMKKRPGPGPGAASGFDNSDESSDPAAFAQAALAGERSRPIDLDTGIKEKMEAHFGLDFGKVRLAQSDLPGKMGVDAIAQGDLIRFAPGAYRPGSSEGERLLGHGLGHLVRQSRMGPGLAGVPIDDPVSESGADNLAFSAMSGTAGAVRAFTPAPAASAPMEGGRLWNRIKQDTHRWAFLGKLGSWWRRRKNKEAARAEVEAEAQAPLKPYAEAYKDSYLPDELKQLRTQLDARYDQNSTDPNFWDPQQNPIRQHPEYYHPRFFPPKMIERLAAIPGEELNIMERRLLQFMARNPYALESYVGTNTRGPAAEGSPAITRVMNRYNSRVLQPEWYHSGRERLENPTVNAPRGDKPENHRIWKATAAQLGGSHSNPFDDGRLAVKQEAIEKAKSIDEVQAALEKYVFGHKITGRIGGQDNKDMDLRLIKDMAKNLAHVAEDFPDIKDVLANFSGPSSSSSRSQMYVNPSGTMGWNNRDAILRGNFMSTVNLYRDLNSSTPFNNASTKFAPVHEAGHLVDYSLTRKIMRGKHGSEVQDSLSGGYGSDVIMRYSLNKLLRKGNKDAQEILAEIQQVRPDVTSFRDLNLVRTTRNGERVNSDDSRILLKALKKRGLTSEYGASQPIETFAETFSKVYEQGEDADEFSKTVVSTAQSMLQHPKRLDKLFKRYDNSHKLKTEPEPPELSEVRTPYRPRVIPGPPRPTEEPQWYKMQAVTPQPGETGGPSSVAVPVPAPAPLPVQPLPARTGGAAPASTETTAPAPPPTTATAAPPVTGDGGTAEPPVTEGGGTSTDTAAPAPVPAPEPHDTPTDIPPPETDLEPKSEESPESEDTSAESPDPVLTTEAGDTPEEGPVPGLTGEPGDTSTDSPAPEPAPAPAPSSETDGSLGTETFAEEKQDKDELKKALSSG